MKTKEQFGANEFRDELKKIMPGYKWTVHKANPRLEGLLEATGIQTSGFNRLSTLSVVRHPAVKGLDGIKPEYEVKSAGYGCRAHWHTPAKDRTLSRALRELQDGYERNAAYYGGLAASLQYGRKSEGKGGAL